MDSLTDNNCIYSHNYTVHSNYANRVPGRSAPGTVTARECVFPGITRGKQGLAFNMPITELRCIIMTLQCYTRFSSFNPGILPVN